jgi:excinuclease ABC subunit A
LITITGVSGSGKSSLAFDTIYKEGQYRYIESLSSYLRQFFNLGERPEIDHCSGLSPAIAIEQNKKAGNSRSSVGTLTEIDDYLRLLYAKLGDSYCYSCGKEIKPQTIEQVMTEIQTSYMSQKIYLLQESGRFEKKEDLNDFVKKNRNKVEK